MNTNMPTKINQLLQKVPRGGVFLASWMYENGISRELQRHYKKSQWLTPIGTGAMVRTGETAINLFVLDFPRYSIDIDITYLPVQARNESLSAIKRHLDEVKGKVKSLIPGIVIQEKPNKLFFTYQGLSVKIEVNDVKRGVIADTVVLPLCKAAQEVFGVYCEADEIRLGFMFCLLGSDRPIVEMLSPNLIDQREALDNQFVGMTS
jgi:hypothetical protein